MSSTSFWLDEINGVRFLFLSQEIEDFITGVSWVPTKVKLASGFAFVAGLSILL